MEDYEKKTSTPLYQSPAPHHRGRRWLLIGGLVLAFISGLPFYAFDVAGNVVELGAGLAAAQVLDPSGDHTSGVLVSMFNMTALAILMVVGGDRLMVRGLALSIQAVPLAGVARMPLGRFIAYSTAGAFLWSILLVYAGTVLGARWVNIRHALQPSQLLASLLLDLFRHAGIGDCSAELGNFRRFALVALPELTLDGRHLFPQQDFTLPFVQ